MRNLSSDLLSALKDNSQSFCKAWQLFRTDGLTLYLTDFDADLTINGIKYYSTSPLDIGAFEQNEKPSTDSMNIEGAFSTDFIKDDDLAKGLWDKARVKCLIVNWKNLTQYFEIFDGFIGSVKKIGGSFEIELKGAEAKFQNQIGRNFSRYCDAIFGDVDCKININSSAYNIIRPLSFIKSPMCLGFGSNNINVSDFQNGKIIIQSGALFGFSANIANIENKGTNIEISLNKQLPQGLQVNDNIQIFKGCDKSFSSCLAFNNGDNFRGCPHMPGESLVISGPSISGNDGSSRYVS